MFVKVHSHRHPSTAGFVVVCPLTPLIHRANSDRIDARDVAVGGAGIVLTPPISDGPDIYGTKSMSTLLKSTNKHTVLIILLLLGKYVVTKWHWGVEMVILTL